LEAHAWIIAIRAQITILHTQLPDHRPKPLLACSQIGSLILGRVEVRWKSIAQLFLKGSKVCWRAVCSSFVPESDKSFVKRPEEVDEMQESRQVV